MTCPLFCNWRVWAHKNFALRTWLEVFELAASQCAEVACKLKRPGSRLVHSIDILSLSSNNYWKLPWSWCLKLLTGCGYTFDCTSRPGRVEISHFFKLWFFPLYIDRIKHVVKKSFYLIICCCLFLIFINICLHSCLIGQFLCVDYMWVI